MIELVLLLALGVEAGRALDARCDRLESEALARLEAGETGAALERIEELVRLRAASPDLAASDSARDAFLNRVDRWLHASAIGLEAFARWRSGNVRAAQAAVAGNDAARRAFSERLALHAAALFDRQKWAEAAAAYALALSERLQAVAGAYDSECARQQLNQALAEFNAGRPQRTRELLEDLRRQKPDYRTAEIDLRLEGVRSHISTLEPTQR